MLRPHRQTNKARPNVAVRAMSVVASDAWANMGGASVNKMTASAACALPYQRAPATYDHHARQPKKGSVPRRAVSNFARTSRCDRGWPRLPCSYPAAFAAFPSEKRPERGKNSSQRWMLRFEVYVPSGQPLHAARDVRRLVDGVIENRISRPQCAVWRRARPRPPATSSSIRSHSRRRSPPGRLPEPPFVRRLHRSSSERFSPGCSC